MNEEQDLLTRRRNYSAAVYDILVRECDADPDAYFDLGFERNWPACREWRFIGNQGFGGKIWGPDYGSSAHVTCYPEDDNGERKAARDRANGALTGLVVPE